MKLKIGIVVSILCGATAISAMHNGVRVVDSKSFDEVLKIGTQEAITQWVKDNKVDLNTRCVKVENYQEHGKTKYMYPIERVVRRYGRSYTTLAHLLTILIAQQVPIDGYNDFNTLSQAVNGNESLEIVAILYDLGADPTKKFVFNGTSQTIVECIQSIITEEKSNSRIVRRERIEKLEKMLAVFASARQDVSGYTKQSSNILTTRVIKPVVQANAPAAQPAIANTTQQPNHNAAAPNNQAANTPLSKPMLFTVRQVSGIAVVSVLCGVGLKMAYDWYIEDSRIDDTDDQNEVAA